MSAEQDMREFAKDSLQRWCRDVLWRCEEAKMPAPQTAAICITAAATFATHMMAEYGSGSVTPSEWGDLMQKMMEEHSAMSAARRRDRSTRQGE